MKLDEIVRDGRTTRTHTSPSMIARARCRTPFEFRERRSTALASCAAGPRCALVFVEYEVTYRIHYRAAVRSMHAKAEKQAQLELATLGERAEGRADGWTDGRTGG